MHGTAREYEESVEAICRTLGIALDELEDWNCCGSSSAHITSEALALALPARNLELADRVGNTLVTPCPSCFLRLKLADKELRSGRTIEGVTHEYRGNFAIKHLADFLWDEVGEKAICSKVSRPLDSLEPVCYYGCLTTRPPQITDACDAEDPQSLDNLMYCLGAKVKKWSFKTDCCGGSLTLTRPDIIMKMGRKVLDMAVEASANCIVTACPMCFSNLDTVQKQLTKETGQDYRFPVFYVSELLGLAFRDKSTPKWLHRHITDPAPFLKQKGLI